MPTAVRIYEAFRPLGEEPARVLAEFIEELEKRKAVTIEEHIQSELRLRKDITEAELRLKKEIEEVRADLTKEIEAVRVDLMKEIESTKLEIEKVRADLTKEIYQVKASLIKWLFVFWVGQIFAFVGIVKWLFNL